MEKKTTMARVAAAVLCFMITVWSLFGMLTVPYCIAMEFPIIKKNTEVQYNVQMDSKKAYELWLQWRLDR